MRCIDAVYLRPPAPSISYRPYTHKIGAFCLVGWLLTKLRARSDGRDLLVLSHDDAEREQVKKYADVLGIPVLRASGDTRLEALADLAMAAPGSHIACFRPELALAPTDLLTDVWRHHIENSSQYTRVTGVPPALSVEIFNSTILAAVGRIRFPGAPPELTQVMERLTGMRSQSADAGLKAVPYDCRLPGTEDYSEDAFEVRTAMDVHRAQAALRDLPDEYEWETIARWRSAEPGFVPPSFAPPRNNSPAVLYVTPCSGYSGAEENLRVLVEGMQQRGWTQYGVVGREGLLAERMRLAGADVFCPNWPFHADTDEGGRFARQLFDSAHVDVVHCNSDPGIPVLREARQRGIPVVTHVRVAYFDGLGQAVEESDHLIASSDFIRRRLLAAGVPEDRITIVYDGIDTGRFRPGVLDRRALRQEFGLPDDAFVVLLVARLAANKRHDLMLHAARLAVRETPRLRLVFVGRHGNPLLEKRIANLRDALGLADRLLWLPFQEDIRRIEAAADVIVLCSDEEPLGTCVLEGMGLGVPVVVSDSGGTHELIENEVSGLTVRGGDSDGLAAALCRLAADAAFRERIAEAARLRTERLFAIGKHAADVARVFDYVRIRR